MIEIVRLVYGNKLECCYCCYYPFGDLETKIIFIDPFHLHIKNCTCNLSPRIYAKGVNFWLEYCNLFRDFVTQISRFLLILFT